MSMNIFGKQDVSFLFSSMNKSTTGSANAFSWLGDYASVKNGSYGKLMKAYYGEVSGSKLRTAAKDVREKTDTEQKQLKEQKEALSKVETGADSLKKSAEALLKTGKDDVFSKEEENAVYDAVSSFVKNYNETLQAAAGSGNKNIESRVNSLTANTEVYKKQLSNMGITIGEDKTLSIDKETFMKADKSKVQDLFQGTGSFGYRTSTRASLISSAAKSAVSETGLYSSNGSKSYSTGNLFNNFF